MLLQGASQPNANLIFVIAIIVLILLLRGKKRSRNIPSKSKRLAWAKFVQEYYSDPANEGKPLRKKDYEFDHHMPFSEGGGHDPENIRVITRKENRKKGAKIPENDRDVRTVVIVALVLFLLYLFSRS